MFWMVIQMAAVAPALTELLALAPVRCNRSLVTERPLLVKEE